MSDGVLQAITDPLNGQDQLLFARAYREHFPTLMSFVRRRVDGDADAADIVQEAYLRVFRYRHRQELAELKALLFQITLNLLSERTRLARSQHRAAHVPLDPGLALVSGDPSQDHQVAAQQDFERLIAAVSNLPRRCRQVFVMRRFQGLDHRQIAERAWLDEHLDIVRDGQGKALWEGERMKSRHGAAALTPAPPGDKTARSR